MFNSSSFNSSTYNAQPTFADVVVSLIVSKAIPLTAATTFIALSSNRTQGNSYTEASGITSLSANSERLALSSEDETVTMR